MFKKAIFPMLLIFLFLFMLMLSGCIGKAEVLTQYENEDATTAVQEKTTVVIEEPPAPIDKENQTVKDITYKLEANEDVEIIYPSFISRAYSDLNTEIFSTAMLRMEYFEEDDTIEQEYEFALKNDKYISILFRGSQGGALAPYPSQYVNCLNWDIEKNEKLMLADEQKKAIAEILPECISASGLLPEQKEYLLLNDAESFLTLIREEAFYLTEEGLFIVLEVPHAVGDYVELSLESFYPAERFLGNSGKLSQYDIMNIAVQNGEDKPYDAYFASPFSDDVIYAKQTAVKEDEAGFELFTYEIYLNEEKLAQTTLSYPEALNIQWIDADTALLMHIFLLDTDKGNISSIEGEGIIEKVMDVIAFDEFSVNMEGDKILLNSIADSRNNCIYYAFSGGEIDDYELYRYDLKKNQWKPLFVDANAVLGDAFFDLQCDGKKLYFTTLSGTYTLELADNMVQKTEPLKYLSPDGSYAMVLGEKGWGLTELESGEVLLETDVNDALWLDEEYFVYASNSRITFFSVEERGIVRTKTIEKTKNIALNYTEGIIYYQSK